MFVDAKALLAEGVAITAIESLEKIDVFDLFYKLENGVALSVGAEQFGDDDGHISYSGPEVAWKVAKEIAESGMADKLEWQAREAETMAYTDDALANLMVELSDLLPDELKNDLFLMSAVDENLYYSIAVTPGKAPPDMELFSPKNDPYNKERAVVFENNHARVNAHSKARSVILSAIAARLGAHVPILMSARMFLSETHDAFVTIQSELEGALNVRWTTENTNQMSQEQVVEFHTTILASLLRTVRLLARARILCTTWSPVNDVSAAMWIDTVDDSKEVFRCRIERRNMDPDTCDFVNLPTQFIEWFSAHVAMLSAQFERRNLPKLTFEIYADHMQDAFRPIGELESSFRNDLTIRRLEDALKKKWTEIKPPKKEQADADEPPTPSTPPTTPVAPVTSDTPDMHVTPRQRGVRTPLSPLSPSSPSTHVQPLWQRDQRKQKKKPKEKPKEVLPKPEAPPSDDPKTPTKPTPITPPPSTTPPTAPPPSPPPPATPPTAPPPATPPTAPPPPPPPATPPMAPPLTKKSSQTPKASTEPAIPFNAQDLLKVKLRKTNLQQRSREAEQDDSDPAAFSRRAMVKRASQREAENKNVEEDDRKSEFEDVPMPPLPPLSQKPEPKPAPKSSPKPSSRSSSPKSPATRINQEDMDNANKIIKNLRHGYESPPDSSSDSASDTDAAFGRAWRIIAQGNADIGGMATHDPDHTENVARMVHDGVFRLAHHIGCSIAKERSHEEHDAWEREDVATIKHVSHALYGHSEDERMRRIDQCASALDLLKMLISDHLLSASL